MMSSPDDDMSLKEIARTLADFRQEFRSQLTTLMRTDVYRADQAALTQRLAQLEKDRELDDADRRATRKLALGALMTCIGTVVAALVLVALGH